MKIKRDKNRLRVIGKITQRKSKVTKYHLLWGQYVKSQILVLFLNFEIHRHFIYFLQH